MPPAITSASSAPTRRTRTRSPNPTCRSSRAASATTYRRHRLCRSWRWWSRSIAAGRATTRASSLSTRRRPSRPAGSWTRRAAWWWSIQGRARRGLRPPGGPPPRRDTRRRDWRACVRHRARRRPIPASHARLSWGLALGRSVLELMVRIGQVASPAPPPGLAHPAGHHPGRGLRERQVAGSRLRCGADGRSSDWKTRRTARSSSTRRLTMKSLKLFVDPAHAHTPTGGVTFAHPSAKPGPVRDRAGTSSSTTSRRRLDRDDPQGVRGDCRRDLARRPRTLHVCLGRARPGAHHPYVTLRPCPAAGAISRVERGQCSSGSSRAVRPEPIRPRCARPAPRGSPQAGGLRRGGRPRRALLWGSRSSAWSSCLGLTMRPAVGGWPSTRPVGCPRSVNRVGRNAAGMAPGPLDSVEPACLRAAYPVSRQRSRPESGWRPQPAFDWRGDRGRVRLRGRYRSRGGPGARGVGPVPLDRHRARWPALGDQPAMLHPTTFDDDLADVVREIRRAKADLLAMFVVGLAMIAH